MKTLPIDLIINRDDLPYEISFDDTIFLMTYYNGKEFEKLFKKVIDRAIKDKIGKVDKTGRLIINIDKLYKINE